MSGPLPKLVVITDWSLPPDVLLARIEGALSAGPQVALQHRNPQAPVRVFLEQGRALKQICDRRGNPLFVNGRLDVALLLDAHLHLPANDLLPTDVRPHFPGARWISIAVHSSAEARAGASADFALVSPVFQPGSKPKDARPALGPEGFERLAAELSCPAYALGGITPDRAKQLDGAAGLSAISAVLLAPDPAAAAAALLGSLL